MPDRHPLAPGPAGGDTTAPGAGDETPAARPAAPAVLPEQSPEDTDAAWGEYPEPSDDRLYRDRPPHWDDF